MEASAPSTQAEITAVFSFYETAGSSAKEEAWLSALPIVMQNPSQQFLWFLISKLEAIREMRSRMQSELLGFVFVDLAIQVLANESKGAHEAALRIQPTTFNLTL